MRLALLRDIRPECRRHCGITAYGPKPMTSNSKAAVRFSKADFIYIRRDDEYQFRAHAKCTRPDA